MQQLQTLNFYVIDVSDIINEYNYAYQINQLLPEITIHGLIALVMSAKEGPGEDDIIFSYLEKILQDKFEMLGELEYIEQAAAEICETIDLKIRAVSAICNHSTSYFWKWLDLRTLVLAHHHEPSMQQRIQRASVRAMENYIYATSVITRRVTNYNLS